LANRFIRDGWSVKALVRTLVLSRAYQLGTHATPAHLAADPANRLVWRHSPRRLDAEEIRDGMLAAAGTLRLDRPPGSPAKALPMVEMRDNGPEARAIHEYADRSSHRSVYLPLLRALCPRTLEAFDPVESTLVTGQRDATTVPSQALYLLNSPWVRRQSLALAERLLRDPTADDAARIRTAFRLSIGRLPTAHELSRAHTFLSEYAAAYREPSVSVAALPEASRPQKPVASPAQPVNPDEIDQTGDPVAEAVVRVKDARTAAWLGLVQALFGAAEFRYVN
jgi:hypothetical protein